MFKEGGNTWQVAPVNSQQSKVTMDLTLKLSPIPSLLAGWMIKGKMNKDTDQLMQDLKHFIETGQPSDAKVKSDKKFYQKRAKK
jgi:hypothetical protein